ncbi:MAG: putative metal-binding motif-containing protein [Actinobacteria bacterium]|nr:putative metal-binding motif-containing protein [Actinomycetota bacterium]
MKLALFAILSGWGCSAIVDASGTAIRCGSDEGCPVGKRCIEGFCESRACSPGAEEICNGQDDDCDGLVDQGHDNDGDGSSWCGGGVIEERDCDDNDPRRHPGATEVCDGADNDCDQVADEESCGEGEACDAFSAVCEPFDCAEHGCALEEGGCDEETGQCVGPDCRDGQGCQDELIEFCDPFTGSCVSALAPLGEACSSHAQCASSFCLDMNVVRLDLPGALCSSLCCTNDDCPDGFVCWESGAGTPACLARDLLRLSAAAAGDGASCDVPEDCASGLCADGRCGLPCCTDDDCKTAQCGMVEAIGRSQRDVVLACTEESGADFGEFCQNPSDCASGLCHDNICSTGCCGSPSCGDGWVCNYGTVGSAGDYFRMCGPLDAWGGGFGSGAVGDECGVNEDCRSAVCRGSGCSDACCSNDDCPPGFACRPRTFGEGFATFCDPI